MTQTASAGFLLLVAAWATLAACGVRASVSINDSLPIRLLAGEPREIALAAVNCSWLTNVTLEVSSSDSRVFACDTSLVTVPCGSNGSILVLGIAIGAAKLSLSSLDDSNTTWAYDVVVTRPRATVIDLVYIYGIAMILGIGMICFGASLDLNVVRERLKKPKSLLIGLACQCTLLPLIAFAIAWATSFPPPLALGVFASGCVPAGGGSNVWARLLGGDVDLSVVLTFFGTIVTFGTMPLWIYTLGRLIYEGSPITVPYLDMLQTLLMTTVPLVIGILVNRFLPKAGKAIVKAVIPLSVIFLAYVFIFGSYVNFFVFEFIRREPKMWAVVCLPYGGMLLSGAIAFACRETKAVCITIVVEVCIQNLGTAIILLRLSLEPPWSDISLCVPILVGMVMALPLFLVFAIKVVYRKLRNRESKTTIQHPDALINDIKEVELKSSLLGLKEEQDNSREKYLGPP